MNTNLSNIERTEFIDLLSAEFTYTKGYGVYAFLSFSEIENLYHCFLSSTEPATAFVRLYVRKFS